ncbi:asparagine synthase-related protein [Zavarzinia sp. CC-PAN008]|uniref:asparagine synthase-related protein n=1 Tax=Zavarzinia sp. CC-PAN008 TaxID=3243332 RepID=UPI003F746FDE
MAAAMALGKARPQVRQGTGAAFARVDGALWSDPAPDGSTALFDGRLDNREAVLAALNLTGRVPLPTDGDLVLAAWRRWGPDFPNQFLGDFACAVWDGTARRLVLARDFIGIVPLVFWRQGNTTLFATEARGLHALPQVPREIDQEWMGRWLMLMSAKGMLTTFRDVLRVVPGETALIDAGGVTRHRYWRPETLPAIRLKRDADYVEAVRALMDEAVRARIGSTGPVAAHLSGGMDSSFVVASAAPILQADGRRLIAYTAAPGAPFDIPPQHRRFGDEWPRAARTAARFPNVDHVRVPNISGPVMDAVEQSGQACDMPVLNPFNQIWINAIGRAARAQGCTRLLTGQMGNMTFSYDGMAWLGKLARQGRWLRLAQEMRALRHAGHSWNFLLSTALEPLFPEAAALAIRRALGKTIVSYDMVTAINPDFARKTGIWDEGRDTGGNMLRTELGRLDPRLAVFSRIDPGAMMIGQLRLTGVQATDPTADRRLAEFCLAIPNEQFLRAGSNRYLARRVLQDLVPDEVHQEVGKGLQAADWGVEATRSRSAFADEIARLEQSPFASTCLDLPRLRRLVDNWPQGDFNSAPVMREHHLALCRGLAAGRFIRQVEGGNA